MGHESTIADRRDWARHAIIAAMAIALGYAFLADLHTIVDFDTGWQLATGRYAIQHHTIPGTDVFSYTAAGAEWIYPPFAGILLYGMYLLGGYAALSWLCALVCAATIALTLRTRTAAPVLLSILAVPLVADRISPRAEMFTTLIFTAFLVELWDFRCGDSARLWRLPLLMLLWVNLHPGFVAGLALIAAFLFMDFLDLLAPARHDAARKRLRAAWPWFALAAAVTLINPWGPRIYTVLVRQNRAMQLHSGFIGEWSATPVSWRSVGQAFSLYNAYGNYWWLLLAALIAIAICLWQRQIGVALLMAAFAYLSLRHLRLQGLFAIATVVIGGHVLDQAISNWSKRDAGDGVATAGRSTPKLGVALAAAVGIALVAVTFARIADLTSNRYYVIAASPTQFGAGESWWFPERAANLIERERLPGNIFHGYELGGFETFRLGPQYPDYIDGRAIPFGPALFVQQQALLAEAPDSTAWQAEAERRNINVLMFSLARFAGVGSFDLRAYCHSGAWRPVYLDEVSAVFLRNRPENRPWLDRLQIDCETQALTAPASLSNADRFNFYSNAGAVLFTLGRDQEALQAFDRAQTIFPFDPMLHLMRAQLLQASGNLAAAEREYQQALSVKESDSAWYALGRLYATEHRYPEAARAIENSIKLSPRPFNNYKSFGQVELLLRQPEQALSAFALAEKASPFSGESEPLGAEFYAQVAQGRAEAWRQLGQMNRAVEFQRIAIQRTPQNASRWMKLAEIYEDAGQSQLAQQARQTADAVTANAKR
jgi:tetratricopeptide (TPR) repeat protein